jgi:hypothetical protein
MKTKRPTTRRGRHAPLKGKLPQQFEPKFLETTDQRHRVVKLIRKRLERLKEEAGCDSFQKEMLAEQAIFISVQLETMKVEALEGQPFDAGVFTQMVNCLNGLLSKLGLKRSATQVLDLDTYVARKTKEKSK